jgi:uncharacterized repeat protein (TIGR01451 family)
VHRSVIVIFTFLIPLFAASTTPIPIAINSGNPVFPFPQFQPYQNPSASVGNLATKNGVGVPHAEMEQTIRDAYRIMMNRAKKMGKSLGGIEYLYFVSPRNCTEGDGYGMLGAVAMADKTTFDGLWLWVHDHVMNKVIRYNDCQASNPDYRYSQLPAVYHTLGENSAADGDFDIAMALLLAYRQWGEFMEINDACGNRISYKQAAIDFLKGLTDTLTYGPSGALLSGDIGIDGYFKGGDSWAELSGWATAQNTATIGITKRVEQPGPTGQYFDYTAPTYFRAFADFLSEIDSAKYAWNIFQFRRAEASSDWLIGKLYQANPKNIPICGNVTISDTTPSFRFTGDMGEDFRLGWRTILNQMWHGTPTSSWNPSTHLVVPNRANTYNLDMAKRYALYLGDNRRTPWNKSCMQSSGTNPFAYWGPLMQVTDINMIGDGGNFYFLNWIPSVGSPSSVAAQDFDLMAQLYRYLDIEWDVDTPGDGYLTSVPFYYHGWYRLLGLLVLSGNYQSPSTIKPTANTKVYLDIDKTFAFDRDTVEYTIDYRNYGSLDAAGVTVVDTLHPDFVFVSATGGGTYNTASHSVTWNIGTLPGFKTATGIAPTRGQVKLKIKVVNPTQKQYRNKVSIFCSNGTGWTSNEYPNNITSVMERNYLDIAKRALVITKTADKQRVKPGSTVQYTIEFENTSDAGWINGGRSGVHFSFSQTAPNGLSNMNTMRARLFHDAEEGYIDLGNYRISYFLFDSVDTCLVGSSGCTTGWGQQITIVEPETLKSSLKVAHELITPGQDALGKWNQRLILQFSDPTQANRVEHLVTIDHHLSQYRGMQGRIHKGGTAPLRIVWFYNSSSWQDVNWSDDWSWDPQAAQDDAGFYFPVASDWTDLDHPDIPVNTWNPKACTTSTKTINNILVEEWDGYTWRRVAGNGPLPGRDAINVTIRDTIPTGFSFVEFTGTPPLNIPPTIDATNRIITWTVSKLQIGNKGTITYTVKADGTCPGAIDRRTINRAWIAADKESPFADSAIVNISCDTVVRPPVPDHLDIILDTTAIDLFNDAPRQRVTMDAGTRTVNAWVVIRDSTGNLLDSIRPFTWTSGDVAIVTVAFAGWQATISKVNAGQTLVVVTSPGLKPDTMSVTTIATPPWPAITSAIMLDNNADIVPDMLVLTLTDTFQVNQRFDSIAITYRGNSYSIAAAAVTRQGTTVRVPFTTLSGIDARPEGNVSLVMTVEAAEKRESKRFTDGVCPALFVADVLENDGTGNDILYLTFTEPIDRSVLIGRQLQLIKMPGGAVIALEIEGIVAAQNDSIVSVEVTPAAQRPALGDSLRLVPGSAGGIIADLARNRPHDLNRAVPLGLRPGPPSILGAWYIDGNADGVIDSIKVQFKRTISVSELNSVVIRWDQRYYTVPLASVFASGGPVLAISTVPAVVAPGRIMTGGAMDLTMTFTQFPDIIRVSAVADSAAPVIDSATLYPGTRDEQTGKLPDTLEIRFSEQVTSATASAFILWSKTALSRYGLTGSLLQGSGLRYRFLVTGTIPELTPGNGDSVWLDPVAAIGDAIGNAQRNELNRRVALKIIWPLSIWTITISNNPFNPEATRVPDAYRGALGASAPPFGMGIRAWTDSPIDPALFDAEVTIYDPLGNTVYFKPMTGATTGLYFAWDGKNKNLRKVGSGTYLALIRIRENGQQVVAQKVLLGVKR